MSKGDPLKWVAMRDHMALDEVLDAYEVLLTDAENQRRALAAAKSKAGQ